MPETAPPPPPTPPATPSAWRHLPWVALVLVAASSVFRIGGADVWWHVRNGEWIAEQGALPDPDPFSHTAPGPVSYTEDLADLLFHVAHDAGGVHGLLVLKVLLVALWAGAVARLAMGTLTAAPAPLVRALATFLVTVLFGLAVQFRLVIKPFLFSYLGTTAVMLILLAVHRAPARCRRLWLLPLLFLLWGHLHRGGTLGLFFVVCATLTWTWQRRREVLSTAWVVTGLSAVALVLNSGGLGYLGMGVSLTLAKDLSAFLPEWRSLTWELAWHTFPWFTALVPLWLVARWRTRGPLFEVPWVAGTVLLATLTVRAQPYAVLAMVPGLARLAGASFEALRRRRPVSLPVTACVLVAAATFTFQREYQRQHPPDHRGTGVHWTVPVDVAEFLKENPPPGRMWNAFSLGGYLLYALAPEQQVFIDGRNDTVYPAGFFAEHLRSAFEPTLLRSHLDQYGITYAVVDDAGPGDNRYQALHQSPDWDLVYWDDVAAVLVRRTSETADYLALHAYRQLRVPTAMERVANWPTDSFPEELADDVLRNAREAPRSMRALFALTALHRHKGERWKFEEAWTALREEALRRGLPPPGGPVRQ